MQRASTATRSSESTQPICFENAIWAYTVGCAIAIKSGAVQGCRRRCRNRHRSPVLLHPRLRRRKPQGRSRSRQPRRDAPLARRQSASASSQVTRSFAAAEGAIKIALNANKVRTKPLRVILNGLGKDAAMIISRINGFTYCQDRVRSLHRDRHRHRARRLIPTVRERTSSATAQTTFPRAWLS